MAETSNIEWTDATWNPITGCSVVSPGCTNCYAMKLAGSRLKHHPSRKGLTLDTKAGPVWNGEVRLNADWLDQPLRWKRPRMIFVCAHGDLFHESVPDEWIDKVFAVMALASQHTFQVLTKRSDRMCDYLQAMERCFHGDQDGFERRWGAAAVDVTYSPCAAGAIEDRPFPLPNVWLGVSVEDQARANERIPDLLWTPAAVRFLSAEPLLGPVNLRSIDISGDQEVLPLGAGWLDRLEEGEVEGARIDWVIVGGESGKDARPMHPDWARALRDQCEASGTAFFFKQWSEWETAIDRDRDDADWRADYSRDFVDSGKSRWLNLAGGRGFHGERFHVMRRVGKKAAGRLLDGVEHNDMPQPQEVPAL